MEATTPTGRIRLRITGKAIALDRVWSATPTHVEFVFRGELLFFHIALTTDVATPSAQDRQTFVGIDFNVFLTPSSISRQRERHLNRSVVLSFDTI